jgi:hypothetical protein
MKHSDFVTKSQQLDLVGTPGARRQDAELNQAPDGEIDESPQLSACSSPCIARTVVERAMALISPW